MPPDDQPTDPTAAASQPGAAAPAAFDPTALPPEALAWFEAEKRKASDAAAAAARRAVEQKAKPAAPAPTVPPASQPAPSGSDDALAILALRDAFDDAVGDLPIKSTQKSLVREAVMRDRPADVSAYVTRFVERAGWNPAASSAPPQPAVPAATVPAPQAPAVPSTHRAPPPPAPVYTENTSILTIAQSGNFAAIDRLVEELGVDKFNERLSAELKRTRVPLT
jgi:hypothetical protein